MAASLRGKAFLEKLEAIYGPHVCNYLQKAHVQSIDGLIVWLKRHALAHFSGMLSGYPGEVYPYLLQFVHVHDPNRYEPESFMCENMPAEAWVQCANVYGTVGKLCKAIRDMPHRVPRGDVYLAFRIGVISAQEFECVPPKMQAGAIRRRRTKLPKQERSR